MGETELRKCPFCGGKAEFVVISKSDSIYECDIGYSFTIQCSKCYIKLPREYRVDFRLSDKGGLITSSDERKSAVEAWNRRNDTVRIAAACAPTAFDKKKVISILTDELRLSEMEKERCATENPSQLRYANGYASGVDFALEIIKKGGIE